MPPRDEHEGGRALRLFVAIPLPAKLKAILAGLRTELDGARWVPIENLHLTLRFLGETHEDAAEALVGELPLIAFEAFEVEINGVGTFPNVRDPRVLYARVVPTSYLTSLQQDVERMTESLGFEPESRPYRPHITLARLRRPDPRNVRTSIRSMRVEAAFVVESVGLYQSELTAVGARHRLLVSAQAC
jgi:RNA 2',3'-cyclic 3'-phosphodiesterase